MWGSGYPSQRATLRYFARRCFHEGQRKAAQAALDGTRGSTATERSYTRRILPHGFLLGLRDAARGDVWGAARAAAIALGFASTTAGFAAGSMTGINRALPDGYADFHSRAMPLLDQHGCTATLFVTTGWVQDADMRLAAPGRMLNWTQITEAADAGVEIGAHTRRHPQLDQLPQKLVREELYTSKQWLESNLGLPVPGLAYPFGYSSARVRALAREAGYGYAYGVGNSTASPASDLLALPRLTVRQATTLPDFRRLVNGRTTMALLEDRALTKGWAVARRVRAMRNAAR